MHPVNQFHTKALTLREKIENKQSGLVFYSLTPPKHNNTQERINEIALKQMDRLKGADIDGLILYDIQDEQERTDMERSFQFVPTLTPEFYCDNYLCKMAVPKIIYKSIANQNDQSFIDWINSTESIEYAVFVGASSQKQIEASGFSLSNAYDIRSRYRSSLTLGGVTIPERHAKKGDEHLRLRSKIEKGCSFFVSQCVYSPGNTKDLLSDYYYSVVDNNREFSPIIFTLAPCGSLKTLEFMEWLGIDVPKWLHNDLRHSRDILSNSVATCKNIASEIMEYAAVKGIPIGFNIESISIKKEEIEASNQLLRDIITLVGKQAAGSNK
ncbi:5,10-methylenetetrahydrofolate reductase [Pollutibacter soli]|uniref:5,10-methylenetetrahydrofolate reductase n=1 Tax=Pollutibacter soli TaxID=3034157 RepID=UPI0030140309